MNEEWDVGDIPEGEEVIPAGELPQQPELPLGQPPAEPPAPKRGGLTTLMKIILVLVIVNAMLCLGAAAYLMLSRHTARDEHSPASATPARLTATATSRGTRAATTTATPAKAKATPTRAATVRVTVAAPRATNTPRTQATPPPATATPIPPTRQPAPSGGVILDDPSLQELLNTLVNTPSGEAVQVTLSEALLNREISASLGGNSTYQHESAQLIDGRLVLIGRGQIGGVSAKVETTVRPYAGDCRLTLEIERMRVGGLPAPRFLIDQLAAGARQWVDGYINAVNFCVEYASVVDRRLILAGHAK